MKLLHNKLIYKQLTVVTNFWNYYPTGKQMEENGLEWCCPNCNKKKEGEGKEREREARKQSRAVKEKDVKKSVAKETHHKDTQKEIQKDTQKDPKELTNTEEIVTSSVQKQQAR